MLNVTTRNLKKESNHQLRKKGIIPICYYANGEENQNYQVSEKELKKALGSHQSVLSFSTGEQAIVREVDRDPISHKILHVSFQGVKKGQLIVKEVPVHVLFHGKPTWQAEGYDFRLTHSLIKIEAPAESLPEQLELDITNLDPEEVVKVSALKISQGEILTDPDLDLGVFSKAKEEVEPEAEGEDTAEEVKVESDHNKKE